MPNIRKVTLTLEFEVDDEGANMTPAEWESDIKNDLATFITEMEPDVKSVIVTS